MLALARTVSQTTDPATRARAGMFTDEGLRETTFAGYADPVQCWRPVKGRPTDAVLAPRKGAPYGTPCSADSRQLLAGEHVDEARAAHAASQGDEAAAGVFHEPDERGTVRHVHTL